MKTENNEQNKKLKIALELYKYATQNYNTCCEEYAKEPVLKNYIKVKKSNAEMLNSKTNYLCLAKKLNEVSQENDVESKLNPKPFAEIEKFETVIALREERFAQGLDLINYLNKYDKKARKEGKTLKADYVTILIDFLDDLDEIELATKVDRKFPKESYIKLPSISKLKLTYIKNLKETYMDLNSEEM